MANVDRPNGFRFSKNLWGTPVQALLRKVPVAATSDIFRGSPLKIVSGAATVAADTDDILGVAVGFGREPAGLHGGGGMFDPVQLENRWFDTSAMSASEWYVWYIPAEGNLFEAQTATALDLGVGDFADFTAEVGDTTTGVSTVEITTASTNSLVVVEQMTAPDNEKGLVNGRYIVRFTKFENMANG